MKNIYDILLKNYGSQGWWPLTPAGSLDSKHHQGKPKDDRDRFEIIVGAILTQNTAWTNVEKALFNLNKAKLLSMDAIKKADVETIAQLIRPAGYFNQKAERLKIIADFFSKNKNPTREELLNVKGIGPETADSISLYAFEKPFFVIDAYTKRIFSRLGFLDENASYEDWQQLFMTKLNPDVNVFKEYHALIVEHAKRNCRKKMECSGCVLWHLCP